MKERRSLVEGLTTKPTEAETAFVFSSSPKPTKPQSPTEAAASSPAPTSTTPARSPLSTRIRGDYAAALKRASLERQLAGVEPNTISDILDEALEPWLKSNGYLP